MICSVCGKVLSEDSKFCNECGAMVTKVEFEYKDDKNKKQANFYSDLSPDEICSKANEGDFNFEDWMDRTSMGAVWKKRLKIIHEKVIAFKDKAIPIGRYIIRILSKVASNFSGAITGAIIGGILGLMISAIPLVGWVLGSLLTHLFIFAGTVIGLASDLRKKLNNSDEEALLSCLRKVMEHKS